MIFCMGLVISYLSSYCTLKRKNMQKFNDQKNILRLHLNISLFVCGVCHFSSAYNKLRVTSSKLTEK